MRVFVTGATGLLGNNIVRQLADRGDQCVVLLRREPKPEVLAGVAAEIIHGEICDASAIDLGVSSCDTVIHCAALIHLGWRREAESMRVNCEGTRTVVDAAIRHSKRMIHIGTVNTLGLGTQAEPANEDTPLDHAGGQVPCNYVVSKMASVDEVKLGTKRGLKSVILHPGFMLGPWDWMPSSGRMIVELKRGWTPFYPTGGCSLCDVRDVAAGVVNAISRGGDDARQYILAGVNWTYQRLWSEMCQRLNKPAPRWPVAPFIGKLTGRFGDLASSVARREGDLNSASLRMSEQFHWYDSHRARKELGYVNRPPEETLDDAVAFLTQHHLS
jgi:dihydroflavonol-4-reductase